MIGLLSFCFFALSGLLLSLSLKPRSGLEFVISTLVSTASIIIVSGYCLSELGGIGSVSMWLACSSVALTVCVVLAVITKAHRTLTTLVSRAQLLRLRAAVRNSFKANPFYSRLVAAFVVVFIVVQVMQLIVALSFAATHHDSNSYILTRMAHYIQQGSLDYYESCYIAETVHAKNATILQIYSFLASGRQESAVNLVAWLSSLLATLGVFGISRSVWKATLPALLAALVFSLLTNNLMLTVTAQSDMPITGFTTAAVYYMVIFFPAL